VIAEPEAEDAEDAEDAEGGDVRRGRAVKLVVEPRRRRAAGLVRVCAPAARSIPRA
jgi:hypothetical protein